MLGKTDPQTNFFNSYIEKHYLPKEHELLKIREKIDFSFIEEEVKGLYSQGKGRISYPPEMMFKILFLEFCYNLSDIEVVKQLRFNVLFRYFVGLKAEDAIPDDTSLDVFRKRLEKERLERIFDKLVKQCEEKGLLKEKLKARDATYITADAATSKTIDLLREGRERVLRAIKKERKELDELFEKYLPKEELSPKPTKGNLAKELNLSKKLVKEVKGKHSTPIETEVYLLEQVVKNL